MSPSIGPQKFIFDIPQPKLGARPSSRDRVIGSTIGVGTRVEYEAYGTRFTGYIAACHRDEDGTLIIDRFRKTKP